MKAILWGMLVVQALAFTVGLALQGEPVIPGTPGNMHAVGTLTDKFLALLGLLATVALCSLFASRDRTARLFGLGMGAGALLIGWLLLQARPFGLSATIAAITLVTFVLLVATLVQDREPREEADYETADEASEPQTYARFPIPVEGVPVSNEQPAQKRVSAPLEGVSVPNEHPAYKRVSAPLEGYGMSEGSSEKGAPA